MSIVRSTMMTASVMFPILLGSSADAAQWTMKGKLEVDHLLPELVAMRGPTSALPSARLHLWARSKTPLGWGEWASAGQAVTSADGHFAFTDENASTQRQFKVDLVFDSDRLRFEADHDDSARSIEALPTSPDISFAEPRMIEVYNDAQPSTSDGWQAGMVDVGTISVADDVARETADLWVLFDQLFDVLDGYGDAFAVSGKTALNYPMALGTVSYANADAGRILLNEHDFDARTALHAFFHIYLHQLSGSDAAMAWQASEHGHATRWREKTTAVPHQEAFAEWAAHKALHEMSGGELDNFIGSASFAFPHHPLSRHQIGSVLPLTEQTIAHVDYTQAGWHSLFNILTYEKVDELDFNSPLQLVDDKNRLRTFAWYAQPDASVGCPDQRFGFGFRDVLAVYASDAELGTDVTDFATFFERAMQTLEGLGPDDVERIKVYLSPDETKGPCKAAF